jgi:Tfp pilus assembly protein PilX
MKLITKNFNIVPTIRSRIQGLRSLLRVDRKPTIKGGRIEAKPDTRKKPLLEQNGLEWMRSAWRNVSREKGAALFLSLLTGVIMLGLTMPFLTKMSGSYHLTEKSYKSMAAMNLAEAGIERAIWEINFGNISSWSGTGSERTLSISNFTAADGTVIGDISIIVYNPQLLTPMIESTGIVAWAGSQNITKTLRSGLENGGPLPLFNFGLFGQTGVTLGLNATIDSYDSRLGAYGGANVHSVGHVGTNAGTYGCITLNENSIIHGSALTGYQSNPDQIIVQDNGSSITGQKTTLDEAKELPSVPAPTGLTYWGNLTASGTSTTISQSGQYANFTLNNNALVTISSNVVLYITGTLTLNNNAEIRINNGCTATFYFGGNWNLSANSMFNNLSHDPSKLVMYGTDTFTGSKTFRNNFATYAAMYVPKADVTFANNAAIYGSIVANSFAIGNNLAFHYDEALASMSTPSLDTGTSSFTMKSWQEKI